MKDPAFLFYSQDFYTGTVFMTDEQVGKFIRLLCLQHQTGHLNEVVYKYVNKYFRFICTRIKRLLVYLQL